MKRTALWALLAASLSANVAVAAGTLRQRRVPATDEPRVFSKVALDSDQRARISMLRSQILATRDEHGRRIAEMRGRLASAIMREPQDPVLVDSILRDIAASQASLQQAAVDHVLAVRAVLRPDQRPPFEEMITSHMRSGGPMECGMGH